jgi:hypothetical protein
MYVLSSAVLLDCLHRRQITSPVKSSNRADHQQITAWIGMRIHSCSGVKLTGNVAPERPTSRDAEEVGGEVLYDGWLVGWLVFPTRFQPRTRSYARLAGMADSRRGADVDPRRPTSLLRAICLQRPAVSLQPLSKYAARPI